MSNSIVFYWKDFKNALCGLFSFSSLFLSLLSVKSHSIKASEVLNLKKRYNNNNNKNGKKRKSETQHLEKCIFNQVWEIKPDSTW